MLSPLLLVGLAQAECRTVDLLDRLAGLRAAYVAEDEPTFLAVAEQVRAGLACLDEALTAPVAAEWHRGMALVSAVTGGAGARERVVGELAAARAIDGSFTFVAGALPESYWRARYDEAAARAAGPARAASGGGELRLDGGPAPGGDLSRPAIAQCLQGARVIWTRALEPDEAPPECAAPAPVAAVVDERPPAPRCGRRLSRGASVALVGSSLALTGASVGFGFWNGAAGRSYDAVTAEDSPADLQAARALTNRTGALSLGTGAGAGALALVVGLRGCW